jgi:hypothetical protein
LTLRYEEPYREYWRSLGPQERLRRAWKLHGFHFRIGRNLYLDVSGLKKPQGSRRLIAEGTPVASLLEER